MKSIKFKYSIIGFVIGAIIFGFIGVVVATNIASSTVDYVTVNNNSVLTVEDALDDLYTEIVGHPLTCYNGVCGKLTYRYWNDNLSGTRYAVNQLPTTNYATRELLVENYGSSNFASHPYYIKSVLIDGTVVGHQACFWYATTSKEFCMKPGYWAGTLDVRDATISGNTTIIIKRNMEKDLGITVDGCSYGPANAHCYIGNINAYSDFDGDVDIYDGSNGSYAEGNGSAFCGPW